MIGTWDDHDYGPNNSGIEHPIKKESQKYGAIAAAQSIEFKGEKMTMQKASQLLKETDESIRKEAFLKITERRMQDVDAFDELFDSLLKKRHEIALNAGFKNFRDYKMEALGRFDYSVQDCYDFHTSVKSVIVPIPEPISKIDLGFTISRCLPIIRSASLVAIWSLPTKPAYLLCILLANT